MSGPDHLAKARDYIAKGDDYYGKAAGEIQAWLDGDASRTHKQVAEIIDRSPSWVSKLLTLRDEALTQGEALIAPFGGDYNTPSRKAGAKKVLREADDEQVQEIVAALPVEAVERVMHAATSDLGRRQRPVRQSTPVGKTLFQRFAEHCFTGWKLQDEMQDVPPPDGDEFVRFRVVAEANLAFAQQTIKWLHTGDFDEEIAQLLAAARESA